MNTAKIIEAKLTSGLSPSHLDVINESHRHNVPANAETHFKVTVVSEEFDGLSLVNRHRAVNKLLSDELQGGVHALALHTLTAKEWQERAGKTADSPDCLGGDGGAVEKAAADKT